MFSEAFVGWGEQRTDGKRLLDSLYSGLEIEPCFCKADGALMEDLH